MSTYPNAPNTLAIGQAIVSFAQALTYSNSSPVYTQVALGEIKDLVQEWVIEDSNLCSRLGRRFYRPLQLPLCQSPIRKWQESNLLGCYASLFSRQLTTVSHHFRKAVYMIGQAWDMALISEQSATFGKLPWEFVMFLQVAGFASDYKVTHIIGWNVSISNTRKWESVIDMMFAPLYFAFAIIALFLLPIILISYLFRSVIARDRLFAGPSSVGMHPIQFMPTFYLLRTFTPFLGIQTSLFTRLGLVLFVIMFCTIFSLVLIYFFFMAMVIFSCFTASLSFSRLIVLVRMLFMLLFAFLVHCFICNSFRIFTTLFTSRGKPISMRSIRVKMIGVLRMPLFAFGTLLAGDAVLGYSIIHAGTSNVLASRSWVFPAPQEHKNLYLKYTTKRLEKLAHDAFSVSKKGV